MQDNISTINPIYGAAAGFAPVSDFQFGEVKSTAVPGSDLIKLPALRDLPNRKLYGWIWAANSATDFYAKAEFAFYSHNSLAGRLPFAVANSDVASSKMSQSVPTVCVVQAGAVQDSLALYISNPLAAQPVSVILQPLYIYGEFDEIRISLTEILNVTNVRLWAGCISSK